MIMENQSPTSSNLHPLNAKTLDFGEINETIVEITDEENASINSIEIIKCPSTEDAVKFISNDVFESILMSLKYFNILRLKVDEKLIDQNFKHPEFKIDGNFLVILESTVDNASQKIIFWKNSSQFITLKLLEGYSAELTNFVVEFLIENINVEHKVISWNNDFQLIDLHDSDDLNLLMKAVDKEQLILIDELLKLPFNINQKSSKNRDEQTAADIAWMKKNFDILLRLLEANSTFPKHFNKHEISDEVRAFCQLNEDLHLAIRLKNSSQVKEILSKNLNLRHFYNEYNESAVTIAMKEDNIEIFEILTQNYRHIGANEDITEINKKLSPKMKIESIKILSRYSIDYSKKYLATHYNSAVTAPDDKAFQEHEKSKIDAYNTLDEIALTNQLLKVTAASKGLRTHFDFNRESVEYIHPYDSNKGTDGITSFNGHICIASKKLLVEKLPVIAVLAHEICHFAMYLTFYNDGKPYAIDDEVNEHKFNQTVQKYGDLMKESQLKIAKCEENIKMIKRLLKSCRDYLIDPSKFADIRNYSFKKIEKHEEEIDDKNYEIREVEDDVNIKNVEIENLKQQIEKCNEKIENIKKNDQAVADEDEIVQMNSLEDKIKQYEKKLDECYSYLKDAENGIIEIKDEIAKAELSELLVECKEICELTDENIAQKTEEYESKIAQLYNEIADYDEQSDYEKIIRSVYKNYDSELHPAELIVRVPQMLVHYHNDQNKLDELKMTYKELFDYYDKFVASKMNEVLPMLNKLLDNSIEINYDDLTDAYKAKFRSSKIKFQGIDVNISEIVEIDWPSKYIRDVLVNNIYVKIGYAAEIDNNFYTERHFIDHNAKDKMEFDDEIQALVFKDKVKENMKDFNQITSIAEEQKLILLSDQAGAGKTTTFKRLNLKLKQKYSNFWIFYVDLKSHMKIYEEFNQNTEFLSILLKILAITDDFEVILFTQMLQSDKIILLFDGVDEISPRFMEFFLKLVESIRTTNNQLWIATRPQHIEELLRNFYVTQDATESNQKAFKLLPYDDQQKLEFIQKVLESNSDKNDVPCTAQEIFDAIKTSISQIYNIESPLMLKMITELYANDKTIVRNFNKYTLYEKMFEMNIEILGDKGKVANRYRDNEKSKFTIWQVHQIYALQLYFSNDSSKLTLNDLKNSQYFSHLSSTSQSNQAPNDESANQIMRQMLTQMTSGPGIVQSLNLLSSNPLLTQTSDQIMGPLIGIPNNQSMTGYLSSLSNDLVFSDILNHMNSMLSNWQDVDMTQMMSLFSGDQMSNMFSQLVGDESFLVGLLPFMGQFSDILINDQVSNQFINNPQLNQMFNRPEITSRLDEVVVRMRNNDVSGQSTAHQSDKKQNIVDLTKLLLFKRWKKTQKLNWTAETISRYGLLIIDYWDSENEFPNFIHRTFAEFFVAKFVIENIYELDELDEDEISEGEIDTRLELLFKILKSYGSDVYNFISSYIDKKPNNRLIKQVLKFTQSEKMQKYINDNMTFEQTIQALRVFAVDDRFLKDFRINNMTIFQKYFKYNCDMNSVENLNLLLRIVELYEKSLGSEWYKYCGYELIGEFPSEIKLQDCIREETNESDENFSSFSSLCNALLQLLYFIEHANLSLIEKELFLGRNVIKISKLSLRSLSLIEKFSKVFNEVAGDSEEVVDEIVANDLITKLGCANTFGDVSLPTYEYLSNLNYLSVTLESFSKIFGRVGFFALFIDITVMKDLYEKYQYFTQAEIQDFIIKNSYLIVRHMTGKRQDFICQLETFIREILNNDKNLLRKFLEMFKKNENDRNMIIFSMEIRRNVKEMLLKFAKEVEMSDDEILSLERYFDKLTMQISDNNIKTSEKQACVDFDLD